MIKFQKKLSRDSLRQDILWFKDISKKDIGIVGGKGANLGEMFSHFPIPNGFCITVKAYQDFIQSIAEDIDDKLTSIDVEYTEQLENVSEEIRNIILQKSFPTEIKKEILENYHKLKQKKVAIRSSATAEDLPKASFAGQQDTYLNIHGENAVIDAVQKCWASLFTARAIFYREKQKFKHSDVFISVVVQEMIDPKYSGVIFTVDPIHKKFILIEIVKGLGEKLVSGEVTPNTYFLNNHTLDVDQDNIQFIFDINLLKPIAKLGKEIEKHYKYPQDIEFSLDKNQNLFILQSRAITTL